MTTYPMLINGELIHTDNLFTVENPATEQDIAQVVNADAKQIDLAVNSAYQAFQQYRHTSLQQRRDYLSAIIDTLVSHRDELAELICREQGKPISAAQGEIDYTLEGMKENLSLQLPGQVIEDTDYNYTETCYKPRGVVAAIAPWNFPLSTAFLKVAPALIAGNTIVLKPSPFTPLATLRLAQLIAPLLPAGVLNIIGGDNNAGSLLTQHEKVAVISFTGSVETGKKIAHIASQRLTKVILELGGNDPAIVLSDVNIKEIAPKLFWASFYNCGQVCVATKRLFVDASIMPALSDELITIAEQTIVGNGLEENTEIGPLNNKMQYEKIIAIVNDAREKGATILCGGEPLPGKGYFYPPTIISNVNNSMRIVNEEQFGPVLPLIPFTDVKHAIEQANNTDMGLGASIWTADIERGKEIAQQFESGVAWVNTTMELPANASFGGVKLSGIECEGGILGLTAMLEMQTLSIAKQ